MISLFQSRIEPTIVCAILASATLPSSLRLAAWRFVGEVEDVVGEQLEFDRQSVDEVLERNGFYLFTRAANEFSAHNV